MVILAFCDICYSLFLQIARKILATFAIFAKFADFSRPFFAFSACKSKILLNLSILLFLRYLLLSLFTIARKILLSFAKLADFLRPFFAFSACKSKIMLNLSILLF